VVRGIFRMLTVLMVSAVCFQSIALASEAQLMAEINALKSKVTEIDQLKLRIVELEKKLEMQSCSITTQNTTVAEIKEQLIQYKPGGGITVPSCGIEITAGATFLLQGTPNANNAGDSEASRLDAAWSADIFIQKRFDDWGWAFMHLEPGQGNGAENELSLYSNVNRDQNDTGANVPVTELWYEHYLFDKQLVITAGKMDPANYIDQNQFAHDETTQFIGRIFRQNPAIEWPDDNSLGGRILFAPKTLNSVVLEGIYFDADNSWEQVFDKPFVGAQFTLKTDELFGLNGEEWDGNYRLYWWMNCLDHSKLVASGEPATDNTKNYNTGFGFSCDQLITETVGIFARFGWQKPEYLLASINPNAAQCETSWSGGMQMTGKYWKRPDDVAAFGIGQVFPSKQYKDAGVTDTGGAAEGHLELYYKCQLFKWLAITPDFQWIWNPHGVNHGYLGDPDTIFVYGVRGQLDF